LNLAIADGHKIDPQLITASDIAIRLRWQIIEDTTVAASLLITGNPTRKSFNQ